MVVCCSVAEILTTWATFDIAEKLSWVTQIISTAKKLPKRSSWSPGQFADHLEQSFGATKCDLYVLRHEGIWKPPQIRTACPEAIPATSEFTTTMPALYYVG
jgi:hypothetical protein